MSKKFTKTVLSAAMAGVLFGVSFATLAETIRNDINDDYYILVNTENNHAHLYDSKSNADVLNRPFDIRTGKVTTVNMVEVAEKLGVAADSQPVNPQEISAKVSELSFSVYVPKLSEGNLPSFTKEDANNINLLIKEVSGSVDGKQPVKGLLTKDTANTYNEAVMNGNDSDFALDLIKNGNESQLEAFTDISKKINAINEGTAIGTSFALDNEGHVTLDEKEGSGERYPVKNVVAEMMQDSTIYKAEDGSYTTDKWAKDSIEVRETVAVNEAVATLDKSIKDRTTVGVNSDGTFTSAEGATNTIAVNEGLVTLAGKTERLDATVGGIDNRVTKNTRAIQSNSRQLQEHNARLNSQQRQINENHEEMKRAAAQSAALSGLFQPYSVGKFNATAALGGYSDKQAVAVGVGYRFNEQTAAKAGIAASEGDVSYNVGVNFEF